MLRPSSCPARSVTPWLARRVACASARWSPGSFPAVAVFTASRSAGYPGEVDEAALGVGVDELHARPIPDIQPLEAPNDLPLRRRPEDADPRPLVGCPRDDCRAPLSGA